MSLFDVVRKALFAGLGAQEKVKELVEELVKKGELNKSERHGQKRQVKGEKTLAKASLN